MAAREYVRGNVPHQHSSWASFSILKRGLVGTCHTCWRAAPTPAYISEFDFRYITRMSLGVNDAERTAEALKGLAWQASDVSADSRAAPQPRISAYRQPLGLIKPTGRHLGGLGGAGSCDCTMLGESRLLVEYRGTSLPALCLRHNIPKLPASPNGHSYECRKRTVPTSGKCISKSMVATSRRVALEQPLPEGREHLNLHLESLTLVVIPKTTSPNIDPLHWNNSPLPRRNGFFRIDRW
jgi:hypothetical protein